MMLVHQPTNSLLLKAVDPLRIREVLANSRTISHPDYNVAVQHTIESTKVLRNLGYDAPAPIRFQYKWPGKFRPFAHQIVMAEFQTMHRRAFNLSEMGAAKTNAALWGTDWLMETGRVDKCLVLAPLSTLERVWLTDLFDTLMHRKATVVHGSKAKRNAAIEADVDFYIMNHDGLRDKDLMDVIAKRPDINSVIVDEGSMFRNHDTAKFKALEKLLKLRPDMRLWWMTGTPCPNDPTDAWAQAKLVSPDRVPKYPGQFKRDTMMQVSQFRWVARADAFTKAFAAMQPAVRFKKSECLDLPPVTLQDRQAEMSTEQRKAFDELKKTMVADLAEGNVKAVNAADQIGKLRQILCGAIKTGREDYETLDHAPRLTVLLEAIEQAAAKVLIVAPFKGIVRALEVELSAKYSVGVLNGDVSPKERNRIINEFKSQPDPHILLCHPKVMSHGLNLTEADTLIFYAPIYSNDEYQQVTERFNRAGQTRKMTIIRMASHPLEWEIYRLLANRQSTQTSILDLYKVVTE